MKWRTIPLDAVKAPVLYAFVGGPFGSNLTTRDYVEEGVPVIRGNNLPADRAFLDDDFVFVTEKKADDLRPNAAYPGDLVFTQRGTLGQIGLIPLEARFQRYVISQSQMKLSVDPEVADARFVYYFFRLPATVQKVINHAITSGVPHINLGILKDFEITLPEIDCQQRTADILSAYDDLIENNRQRMALLEEAARQLYREWFVRLRFPGHEHTRITKGVPEGWEQVPLGERVTLNYGKSLKAEDRTDGPCPVYGSSGIVGYHEKSLAQGPGIVIGRKGNVGSVYWSAKDYWPIDTVYYVDPQTSNLWFYYALQQMHFISTDVAVPGLNRDFAYSRLFLVPPARHLHAFLDTVEPLHEQVDKLGEMNKKLSAARDLLLQRLMNGEIAV
ncbi:MAG: restriction endonuclease subunit S [Thermodesulfobacteriota bacterium]